jgi:hypothetical protein
LTLHGVLYGISKFANGFLADRSSSRAFLTDWTRGVGSHEHPLRLQLRRGDVGPYLDAERLVSRHGLSALRAADGELVSAEAVGNQVLDLEPRLIVLACA